MISIFVIMYYGISQVLQSKSIKFYLVKSVLIQFHIIVFRVKRNSENGCVCVQILTWYNISRRKALNVSTNGSIRKYIISLPVTISTLL